MSITEAAPGTTEIDTDKLMGFVFKAVDEVGATLNAALVVMGDKLGYYRDLAAHGPTTPAQLAERTETAEPYAREWLNAQAAGGYVTYDPATRRYTLPPEHALAMTDADSPAFLPGFFQIALGTVHDTQHIVDAARSGAGYGWHEHDTDVHIGCEGLPPELSRESRRLVDPGARRGGGEAREGGPRRRRRLRARGVDDPLGAGVPNSTFVGSDYHAESIETARARAAEAGVEDRVRFEVASAQEFTGAPDGTRFDLVAMFDCLHDMGDPVGAARHVREVIADDGTWMIVEPMAGDHVEDNLNPVGRASTASRRCCARRRRCRRTSGSRSARRRVRHASATSQRPGGSRGSAASPRRRSTA